MRSAFMPIDRSTMNSLHKDARTAIARQNNLKSNE